MTRHMVSEGGAIGRSNTALCSPLGSRRPGTMSAKRFRTVTEREAVTCKRCLVVLSRLKQEGQ